MKTEINYRERMHGIGRRWMVAGLILMFSVPVITCIIFDSWPNLQIFLKGSLSVILIFWVAGFVEAFSYMPMLGTGGSYLAFVTGNISNLKLPCAINAMKAAGAEKGSEEAEVISTIAIAVSSIVTTLVIALFLILFLITDIQTGLQTDFLKPAFDNLLPALLGGFCVMIVSRHIKMALLPLLFMILLFAFVPSLAGAMGVLVPVGIVIAVISARIFYKKGWA